MPWLTRQQSGRGQEFYKRRRQAILSGSAMQTPSTSDFTCLATMPISIKDEGQRLRAAYDNDLISGYSSSLVFLTRYSGILVMAPSLRYPLFEKRMAYLG